MHALIQHDLSTLPVPQRSSLRTTKSVLAGQERVCPALQGSSSRALSHCLLSGFCSRRQDVAGWLRLALLVYCWFTLAVSQHFVPLYTAESGVMAAFRHVSVSGCTVMVLGARALLMETACTRLGHLRGYRSEGLYRTLFRVPPQREREKRL